MMGNASTSAAWSSSPVDECLDKLGTCEATVSECETANHLLEAQMALLRHPKVVIGLACGIAVFMLLALLRCCWHVRAGAVAGAFPWDLFPGWILRRIWRLLRWPFVQAGARLFGPQLAEGVAGVLDEVAVSPEVAAPIYATIHHAPSVPTYRGLPAGAVFGVQRAESTPSVATVYYSAASRPLPPLPEGSLRSTSVGRPSTPARKRLDFEGSVVSRHTTVIDVSIFFIENRFYYILWFRMFERKENGFRVKFFTSNS
jgi:hypothetical protein